MFEIITPLIIILYQMAVSLGVGSSTLAIASFLTALSDGEVEKGERRMLGVIYTALRVSMVSILIALTYLSLVVPNLLPPLLFIWVLVAVLYLNAIAMTKHWMPVQVGPSLQAASWYTLGFVLAIDGFGLYVMTPTFFLTLYGVNFVIFLVLVNGCVRYLKPKK